MICKDYSKQVKKKKKLSILYAQSVMHYFHLGEAHANFLIEWAETQKREISSWFQLKFKTLKAPSGRFCQTNFSSKDSAAKKVNYKKNINKMSLKHISTQVM